MASITALDSALFAAFNAHDAAALGGWFTPDLEFYHDKGDRTQLTAWADHKGPAELESYRQERNTRSIDGLPTGWDSHAFTQ